MNDNAPTTHDHATGGGAAVAPLTGIKVVEIGQNLSAPFTAEILAMLGADVYKVERPEGDDARAWGPPFPLDLSTTFHANNRGKRSIALDLKNPRHADWLRGFLKDTDILVHNLRAGVAETLGFGAADCAALNPRLVYCYLSAFGTTGPLQDKPGYEVVLQAFAGLWAINGWEGGPPSRVGLPVLDLSTGVWGALGCVAALQRRERTGLGGTVHGSLFETGLALQRNVVASYSASGTLPERSQAGGKKVVPYGVFRARDGDLLIACSNNRLFAKLARALGRDDWVADASLQSNPGRLARRDELLGAINGIIGTATIAHWMDVLEAAGVPCSPVQNIGEVLAHPQTAALGIVDAVPGEDMRLVGLPLSFDGQRPVAPRPAPATGADNQTLGAPLPD